MISTFEYIQGAQTERRRPLAFTPFPLPIRRPLVCVQTAATVADQPVSQILEAIDSGEIRYAFDLRSAESGRRLVRILATSLRAYVEGRPANRPDTSAQLQTELAEIIPQASDVLTTPNVSRITGCDPDHVVELVRRRLLKCVGPYRRGHGGAARVTRRSVVEFLLQRRIR